VNALKHFAQDEGHPKSTWFLEGYWRRRDARVPTGPFRTDIAYDMIYECSAARSSTPMSLWRPFVAIAVRPGFS
jgi:hypothetical protein